MIRTADTYTGSLNVKPTPELNPFLHTLLFRRPLYFIDEYQRPRSPPTIPSDELPNTIGANIKNDGDETIDARVAISIDGGSFIYTSTVTLAPGELKQATVPIPSGALAAGTHTISYTLQARAHGTPTWNNYYSNRNTYTVEAPAIPSGDITKVELDSQLLPEGGTLDWVRTEEATIKVYFKNTGNVASKFHIWVTDEDGATLCEVTTSTEIPADGVERYVTCGTFTPTEVEKKTLTAHIEP